MAAGVGNAEIFVFAIGFLSWRIDFVFVEANLKMIESL